MQNILGAPAVLLEKKTGADESFGAACTAQLVPYLMGSFAVTN